MTLISKKLDAHFAACAAAAAGAAAIGGADNAEAAIVYSGAVSIAVPSTFAGVYLNVVTGLTGSSSGTTAGWDVNPYGATYLRLFSNTGGGHANVAGNFNLAPGTTIDGTSTWATGVANGGAGTAIWNFNSTNNIVGFRFQNEAAGNQVQYGWYRLSLSSTNSSQPRTIVEYAYENTGAGILAGQTPAPGALALLALGGLVGGRRRKVA